MTTTYYINPLDSNTWTSVFALRQNEYCITVLGEKFGLIYRDPKYNGFSYLPVALKTISATQHFTLISCEIKGNEERVLPNSITSQTRCYRVLTRTQYEDLFDKTIHTFKSGRAHFADRLQNSRNCPPARL